MAESIRFSLEINGDISGKLKSIAGAARGCSKAVEELARSSRRMNEQYRDLNKRSETAAREAQAVKKAMEEMAESLQKSGDEAAGLEFEKLREQYESLREAAEQYAEAAKTAAEDARTLREEARRAGGNGGSGGGNGGGDGGNGGDDEGAGGKLWDKLGKTGWLQQMGGALGNLGNAWLKSALGEDKGGMVSGILSGAVSGAAGGMVFGNIWGALGGAVIGGIAGAVNGITQEFEKENDAFKDYYKSLYEGVGGAAAEELTAGSAAAAERERMKLTHGGLAGAGEQADALLADLIDLADSTGLALDSLTGMARTMLKAGTAAEDVLPVLEKMEGAGAALGLTAGDAGTAAALLGRMQTQEQASTGDLEQLEKLGLDVFGWLAEQLETDEAGVRAAVSEGELTGNEAGEIILGQMEKLYGDVLREQAGSTAGLDSRLQGLREDIGAAGGESYNDLRSESKALDIAAYGGALGDKLAELSAVGGRTAAYSENLREQFQREALSAVLLGELDREATVFSQEDAAALEGLRARYAAAEALHEDGGRGEEERLAAGLEMQSLKEEAEALAKAAYESSGWYQKELDTELEEIEAIRELTRTMKSATNAWRLNNAFTKGGLLGNPILEFFGIGRSNEEQQRSTDNLRELGLLGYGLDYVPYDEFPALLHEGERVLTAEAARRMDRGGGGVSVTVTGNAFHVRQASDIDEIAAALARKLRAAALRGGV